LISRRRFVATTAGGILCAPAYGSPMTYLADGKQFIVIPVGGANIPAELVALTLP